MKQAVFALARAAGGFKLARRATRRSLRILCYHGLWATAGPKFGDRLFIEPEQFDARMKWLASSGYPILRLGEAVRRLADGTLPDAAVAVTIDDGWASTYSHMLPSLERHGIPATVYVTTWYIEAALPVINVAITYILQLSPQSAVEWQGVVYGLGNQREREALSVRFAQAIDSLDERDRLAALIGLSAAAGIPPEPWLRSRQFHLMTPTELADAVTRGLDVQLHTHRHIDIETGVDRLGDEIAENRHALQVSTGQPATRFDQFCYPSGTYSPRADAILSTAGVHSATLVDQGINAPDANPYRLRRFLDGRSATQLDFEAYLSGALEFADMLRGHTAGSAVQPSR